MINTNKLKKIKKEHANDVKDIVSKTPPPSKSWSKTKSNTPSESKSIIGATPKRKNKSHSTSKHKRDNI